MKRPGATSPPARYGHRKSGPGYPKYAVEIRDENGDYLVGSQEIAQAATLQLKAYLIDTRTQSTISTSPTVVWHDDSTWVSVDSTGLVTVDPQATIGAECTVRVTTPEGLTDTMAFTVTPCAV